MKPLFILLVAWCSLSITLYAHPGVGIVENSKGEIFFTDLKQVWKINTQGKLQLAVPGVHTHELYLDDEDNLFGEHLWYSGESKNTWGHNVWRLSAGGSLTKVIPDTDGFLEDYSFVRDHHGRMYWADRSSGCQKVARLNADNTVTRLGDQCFHNIRKIATLPDGSLFLVDFQDIKKIDPAGKVKAVASRIANKKWVTSNPENQNAVMGIWSDKQGNLYSAVSSARLVKKFDGQGKEFIAFKSVFPWSPSGGLVDSRGRLWVLEYNPLNAVRVICSFADGNTQTFAP